MAKRLTAEQFESQYGDTMRREYAEYVTPRTLLRALEHRRPRIPVSEGVLRVWFSKQAAPAGTVTVWCEQGAIAGSLSDMAPQPWIFHI